MYWYYLDLLWNYINSKIYIEKKDSPTIFYERAERKEENQINQEKHWLSLLSVWNFKSMGTIIKEKKENNVIENVEEFIAYLGFVSVFKHIFEWFD